MIENEWNLIFKKLDENLKILKQNIFQFWIF